MFPVAKSEVRGEAGFMSEERREKGVEGGCNYQGGDSR